MTAVRLGASFALEDEFGKGPGSSFSGGHWLTAPPNFFLTYSHHRSTNRMDAMGTKKFDYIAYGGHHGTWSVTYTGDYEYLEPLLAVFEKYDKEPWGYSWINPNTNKPIFRTFADLIADGENVPQSGTEITGEWQALAVDSAGNLTISGNKAVRAISTEEGTYSGTPVVVRKIYRHLFQKSDTARVPSMCFRRVQLNRLVNGKYGDEILEIYGAVCTEFSLSISAGSSQVQISMSGFAKDVKVKITDLEATEYAPYVGEHVMFACLFNRYMNDTLPKV